MDSLFLKFSLSFFALLLLNSTSNTFAQTTITLNSSESSSFVLDPENFDPEDEENSLFKSQPLGNIDHTTYTRYEREDGSIVIKAESVESASGLVVPIDADPNEFRYIQWEWKIGSVLEKGDLTKKSGDDYAARIYITFNYDPSDLGFRDRLRYRAIRMFTSFDVPLRSLNYLWANKAEKGTFAGSPYTDWVQLVAVQSGNDNAGTWQIETRNILEDYRKAFGEEPPRITGISIMTDSDDTKSSAVAYYGKITLSTTQDFSSEL